MVVMENVNLLTVFLTGLITGGLTCMAVQGGLLASCLATREEEKFVDQLKRSRVTPQRPGFAGHSARPILTFLFTKLVAYTTLGFLLGMLGSVLQLSLTTRIVLQFGVGVFMIGTALNLLNVHPIFRYFVIQPPKFLTRMLRRESKSKGYLPAGRQVFAPAILGAFTIFIPCGTTQAMMAFSIASGSAALGAAIMFVFVLGTSPVFFLLGYLTTKLSGVLQAQFMKVAASAIILLAIFNINNAIALSGSRLTLEDGWETFQCTFSFCDKSPIFASSAIGNFTQEPTIVFETSGYKSENLTVRASSPVSLRLVNKSGAGCIQSFTIPQLGVEKVVPLGKTEIVAFKAPDTPGDLPFMCGMGMFRGVIKVI